MQPLYSHPDTLRSINNLALYDDNQQGGMTRPSHGLEKHRATLGNSDPDTLNSINNLEVLYDNQQGRYDEAEQLYLEGLE